MLLAAEEREQDIPGKLEQQAESETTTAAVPGQPATGTPDLAGQAVSNTSEESRAPVKQAVEGPAGTVTRGMQGQIAESADTVINSGMQGQVAVSATSSNARQQSTSSVASTRPASKPTSTVGACTCTLQGTTVFE